METLKQQLKRNKEEFDKYSGDSANFFTEVITKVNAVNIYTSSLSSIIKLLIQEEEKEMKEETDFELSADMEFGRDRVTDFRIGFNEAKQDSINRLKELLKLIEE